MKIVTCVLIFVMTIVLNLPNSQATEIIIEASGSYIMDSRLDETPSSATARAREEAKRIAVEKAGVYVESYTKVVNLQVDEDEVRTIASQILKIQNEKSNIEVIDDNLLKFTVEITALVDDSDPKSLENMMMDKKNLEESTRRNKKLQEEYDALKHEMEELQRRYESATSDEKLQLKLKSAQNISKLSAIEKLNQGNESYLNRNYNSALNFYNQAIELDPTSAEAYNNRGLAYYHLNLFTESLSDFTHAIEIDPNFAYAYNNRGLIHDIFGQPQIAIQDYTKALQINQKFAFALNNRGNSYATLEQYQNAERDLKVAAKLEKNSAEIHNNLGNIYRLEEKYPEAIKEYTKALELNSNYAEAYYNRGIAYYIQGKKQNALKDITQANKLDPQDPEIREMYNRVSREMG